MIDHQGIYSVPFDRHVPENAVTLGLLLREVQRRKDIAAEQTDEEKEQLKRISHHVDLYARWCRMALRQKRRPFPATHAIHNNIIEWELHVCRFAIQFEPDESGRFVAREATPEERSWFFGLHPIERMDLCDFSRDIRRKLALSKSDEERENENDTASYSTL